MNVDAINDLLGITEGYQLPDKLLRVLEANEHGAICELLTAQEARAVKCLQGLKAGMLEKMFV